MVKWSWETTRAFWIDWKFIGFENGAEKQWHDICGGLKRCERRIAWEFTPTFTHHTNMFDRRQSILSRAPRRAPRRLSDRNSIGVAVNKASSKE